MDISSRVIRKKAEYVVQMRQISRKGDGNIKSSTTVSIILNKRSLVESKCGGRHGGYLKRRCEIA